MISEPAGVAKMTRVMKMMIYNIAYHVSSTSVRHVLMSVIGQQPSRAYHPKENIFEHESRNCNKYAGIKV